MREVNALGLPVTIHLEDQMIPLPPSYAGGPMEGSAGPDSSTLWRSDTDGDLAKWLNSGFTPRAVGMSAASLLAAFICITATCLSPAYIHSFRTLLMACDWCLREIIVSAKSDVSKLAAFLSQDASQCRMAE